MPAAGAPFYHFYSLYGRVETALAYRYD
jgi:hypothetical protein